MAIVWIDYKKAYNIIPETWIAEHLKYLAIVWIDYKKAYTIIPETWIAEHLKIFDYSMDWLQKSLHYYPRNMDSRASKKFGDSMDRLQKKLQYYPGNMDRISENFNKSIDFLQKENRGLLPREQKRSHKRTTKTNDMLDINQHTLKDVTEELWKQRTCYIAINSH